MGQYACCVFCMIVVVVCCSFFFSFFFFFLFFFFFWGGGGGVGGIEFLWMALLYLSFIAITFHFAPPLLFSRHSFI